MRHPLLIVMLLLLSPMVSAVETQGEILLMAMPLPEMGWAVRNASNADEEIVEWVKAESGDAAAARILKNRGGFSADEYRRAVDQDALTACSPYGSREISASNEGPYPHRLWIARCSLDQTRTLTVLHLYISGRDYGYYLTRKWRGTPSDEALAQWVDYFADVALCDSRPERGVACPE